MTHPQGRVLFTSDRVILYPPSDKRKCKMNNGEMETKYSAKITYAAHNSNKTIKRL